MFTGLYWYVPFFPLLLLQTVSPSREFAQTLLEIDILSTVIYTTIYFKFVLTWSSLKICSETTRAIGQK